MPRECLRIGCGAGFAADRLDAAEELVRRGDLHWLALECLGERTLAFAHRDRARDPTKGYDPRLERRMRALLPLCRTHHTRLISNMGAANVPQAAQRTLAIARELGLFGMRVACVLGDDVRHLLAPETPLLEGGTIAEVGRPVVGANAYLGADAILPAIETGADVILTGRVADPSLFLAPLRARFGWQDTDLDRLAAGVLVGHLLECGMQVTGGYFADPGFKDVPDLARCGYPLAEVAEDGSAVITKVEGTGGMVDRRTVLEQLFYEVHDPAHYLGPDVTADFSQVMIAEVGRDRVRVWNARGKPPPQQLKVTVGFDAGWLGEAGISYAGPNALARAELAREVLRERLLVVHGLTCALRFDLVGVDSLHATAGVPRSMSEDVRLRVACRSIDREEVEFVLWEVEAMLCCGPAGGGGFRARLGPVVETRSCFLPRAQVRPCVEVLRA
ncbi:hypothetical protein HRbin40_02026 [bacterium HR40]|nr:hypothetical protein HRbin40_02026 [bacterium HR40]